MPLKTKLGIGLGATIVGAGGIIGGLLGTRSGGSNPEANNNGGVAAVSPTKTEAPPTPTFTVEPSKTPSPTETPSPTPTPEVLSVGQYESFDSLPFSQERIDAIKKMTVDCDPKQTLIFKNGVICLQTEAETRTGVEKYQGQNLPVGQIHSLGLDLQNFPNAINDINTDLQRVKYQAWKNQTENTNITFDQYLQSANSESHPFSVWAYNGNSTEQSQRQTLDNPYIITKIIAHAANVNVVFTKGIGYEVHADVENNILSVGDFTPNPSGAGLVDPITGQGPDKTEFLSQIAGAWAGLSEVVPTNLVGGVLKINTQTIEANTADLELPLAKKTSSGGYITPFVVSGTSDK